MTIKLDTPGTGRLSEVVQALREWQHEGAPIQLHPGDLGWFWRFGAAETAMAVRTWSRDGQILAVGLLDGSTLLRLAVAPDAWRDGELAQRLSDDMAATGHGVLTGDHVYVEAPTGSLVRELLSRDGWNEDEPRTPLRRDLSEPVTVPQVRIEPIGAERASLRSSLQRAAFDGSTFTDERWHAMATGLPYTDGRCLIAYDHTGHVVAAVTVWSAGVGRPGLLEPMGVHRDHRRRGYGAAISTAAAAALKGMGSTSAIVCTPSSNLAAIATYTSAGFNSSLRYVTYTEAPEQGTRHGAHTSRP